MAQLDMKAPAPLKAPGDRNQAPKTRVPPNSRFWLVFDPNKWLFFEGEVIPALARMPLSPGVGLVDRKGDPTLAVVQKQKLGKTVIPEEWAPDGNTYLRYVDGEHGTVWLTQWERCYVRSIHVDSADPQGYAQWLRGLIEDEKLPDIAEHLLEALVDDQRKITADAEDTALTRPSSKPLAEKQQARLAALEAYVAKRGVAGEALAPAAPKPKRVPRRKSE